MKLRQFSSSWDVGSVEGADRFKVCRVTLLQTLVLEIIFTVGRDASSGMASVMYCHSKIYNQQPQNLRGRQ